MSKLLDDLIIAIVFVVAGIWNLIFNSWKK